MMTRAAVYFRAVLSVVGVTSSTRIMTRAVVDEVTRVWHELVIGGEGRELLEDEFTGQGHPTLHLRGRSARTTADKDRARRA